MVKEYQKLNHYLGTPFYKTNDEAITRIWAERIADENSEFFLFALLREDDSIFGAVALRLHKERGEILMVALEEGYTFAEYQELLEFAVQFLKDQGAKLVSFEVAPFEEDSLAFLQKKGAKEVSTKYLL